MIAALLVVRFFDEAAAFLPAGALESFRDELDLSYAQAGAVLTAIAPGALAGNLAVIAADYTSRRLIVVGGALGYAASMLTFAVGDSFVVMLLGGLLLGAASTAMVDGCEVALVDAVSPGRLRVLLARQNLAAYAGDVVGPVALIAVAAAGLSWRAAFVVVAALLVAYAAVLSLHPLPAAEREPDAPRPAGQLMAVLRDRAVWVLAGLMILLNPLDETVFAFGIAFLDEERGLSTSVAVAAALLGTIGGIAGLLAAPRLDGRGDDELLIGCGVGLTGCVLAFAVLPGPVALAPMLGIGAGVAIAWTVLQHRQLTLRPGAAGTTKAVISTLDTVSYLTPIGIGVVIDHLGLQTGIALFAVLPAAFAVLAWMGIHLSRARLPYRDDHAGGPHHTAQRG